MGMRINTNINSLRASNALKNNNMELSDSYNKLSTGLRINKAADDSAGLAVSAKFLANAKSMDQAVRNLEDGINIGMIAESGYNEIYNNLSRMRELAVQASTGTVTTTDRSYMNSEASALRSEIDRIADTLNFNGQLLLNGDAPNGFGIKEITVQGGIYKGESARMVFESATSNSLGLSSFHIDVQNAAQVGITDIDRALDFLYRARSTVGSTTSVMQAAMGGQRAAAELWVSTASQIRDVDFAVETANLSKRQILQQSGVSVLSQANSSMGVVTSLL